MRVLLVDDDPRITRAWARILERDHHEVITANSPAEARGWLREATGLVHLALVDLVMQEGSGLALIPEIQRRFPDALVVLVTAYLDTEASIAAQEIVALVVTKPLNARMLRRLVRLAARPRGRWGAIVARCLPALSAREAQVVTARMEGINNQGIADQIGIGVRTVETLWRRIYDKTGLRAQPEIVAFVASRVLDEKAKARSQNAAGST